MWTWLLAVPWSSFAAEPPPLAQAPLLSRRAPEGLAFVTESGAPLHPLHPPKDWLVLQDGRAIGPRRFARVVHDRRRSRAFSFGDFYVFVNCATFSLLGAVPAVASLSGRELFPSQQAVVPAGLVWSASWLALGLWYAEGTSGKRAVRGYYALDEAMALSLGEPLERQPLPEP